MRCLVLALTLVMCLSSTVSAATDDGTALYAERCASCHGDVGQGSNVAPSLIDLPASDVHLMLDTGRMPAAEPYANELHLRAVFTQEQMSAIVSYVLSLSPHSDPRLPQVGVGDAARGRQLFDANCAQCHGVAGSGSAAGYEDVAPSLVNATVFQVAEAIRAGPGVMPRFGADQLSDRDVADIARYVNVLQTGAGEGGRIDAGGFSLGHVGAVAEGFIGWFFGLGAILLFVRWIGAGPP